ncbi:MAG: hypothetical protein K2O42_06460, partial [Oscillospiraceae bacterium]|nr:hypothetical protein [Oscillospiraceae bacterium]
MRKIFLRFRSPGLRHKSSEKFYYFRGKFLHLLMHALLHFRLLMRWMILASILGILLGVIGAEFVKSINWSTQFRNAHIWCYGLLPVGGIFIIWLYRVTKDKHDKGTNMVLASLRSEAQLPVQ